MHTTLRTPTPGRSLADMALIDMIQGPLEILVGLLKLVSTADFSRCPAGVQEAALCHIATMAEGIMHQVDAWIRGDDGTD